MNNYIIERIKYYKNCDYGKIVLVQQSSCEMGYNVERKRKIYLHCDYCGISIEDKPPFILYHKHILGDSILAKTMQGNNIARVFCHDRCDLEYEKIKDALKRSNKNE